MKKIIITILIFNILFILNGCYSSQVLESKEEVMDKQVNSNQNTTNNTSIIEKQNETVNLSVTKIIINKKNVTGFIETDKDTYNTKEKITGIVDIYTDEEPFNAFYISRCKNNHDQVCQFVSKGLLKDRKYHRLKACIPETKEGCSNDVFITTGEYTIEYYVYNLVDVEIEYNKYSNDFKTTKDYFIRLEMKKKLIDTIINGNFEPLLKISKDLYVIGDDLKIECVINEDCRDNCEGCESPKCNNERQCVECSSDSDCKSEYTCNSKKCVKSQLTCEENNGEVCFWDDCMYDMIHTKDTDNCCLGSCKKGTQTNILVRK